MNDGDAVTRTCLRSRARCVSPRPSRSRGRRVQREPSAGCCVAWDGDRYGVATCSTGGAR